MSQLDSELERVGTLADSFLEHYRRGEQPHVSEYTERHPELATLIRDLFPAVLLMEQASPPGLCCASPDQFVRSDPLPGNLGEYRLLREIGCGGMGIVYEAIQERLERRVALKMLPSFSAVSSVCRERFRQEAKVVAQLQHPNIVPVFDVGERSGVLYYVMQYISGRPLDRMLSQLRARRLKNSQANCSANEPRTGFTPWIRRGDVAVHSRTIVGDLPDRSPSSCSLQVDWEGAEYFRFVAQIGLQAADALRYAHQHGVLHRDIKPSNLLLDDEARLWITDFGLAKLRESGDLTQSGEIVGTLRYMAPERFRGQSDPRSDLYSLGATLYELLTLRPMYPDQDRMQLVHQIVHDLPPPPCQLDSRIPPMLEAIVLKAIARDPDERYATAEAMRDDLQRFLAGASVLPLSAARPTSSGQYGAKYRRPALAACLAAVIIGSLMFISTPSGLQRIFTAAPPRIQAARNSVERPSSVPHDPSPLADAHRHLQRGLQFCEQGQISRGLLMIIRSLPHAVQAGDASLERTIRRNLNGWYPLQRLGTLIGEQRPVTALAVTPDGEAVLMVSGNVARLWNVSTGHALGNPIQRNTTIRFVLFRPDGKQLLVGCSEGVSQLYDTASGNPVGNPLEHQGWVVAASFSGDGRYLLLADSQRRVQTFDVQTGQAAGPLILHSDDLQFVTFHSSSQLLTADRTCVRISDAVTGQLLGQIQPSYAITAVAVSADGDLVLTGGANGEVQCWDVATRQPGPSVHHSATITAAAFSPDGTRMLIGSADGLTRLWESRTAEPAGPAWQQDGALTKLAFSPNGQTVAVLSERNIIRMWDPVTGYQLGAPMCYQTPITAFGLATQGTRLVVGTRNGLQVHILPLEQEDDPELAHLRMEMLTATQLDEYGKARPLSMEEWLIRYKRLLQRETELAQESFKFAEQLEEQLRASPEDARLWEQRGWLNTASQRWQEAIQDFGRAEQLDPVRCNFSGGRAYCYANLGNWSEAANDYGRMMAIQPNAPEYTFIYAAMLHLAGRSDEYVKVCQEAVERFGDIDDPRVKYIVARMCVLAPDPRLDPAEPLRLADEATKTGPLCPPYLHTHGLALIRAGRYEQAIRRLHESTESGWYASVLNHLALAIAHHHAGRPDHARRALAEAERILQIASELLLPGVHGGYPPHPHEWPACIVLQQEARALIHGR